MRIATSSIRSIRKRLPDLLRWLQDREPDIVALQKISVTDADFPATKLEQWGYRSVVYGRKCREDYGVAVLTRQELPEPIVLFRGLPCPEASGARLLTVDVGGMWFSSVYAPFGNPKKLGAKRAIERRVAWLRHLHRHLRDKGYPDRYSLLCGDFNTIPDGRPRPPNYTEEEQGVLADICRLGFADIYRRAHPDGEEGFNFGFNSRKEGTTRLHLALGSERLADHFRRDAWVDLKYRTEAAPVVVELKRVPA